MNYTAMMEQRTSVRGFECRQIGEEILGELRQFYEKSCHRLIQELAVELQILPGTCGKPLLEAAGYEISLEGAPCYLLLLSGDHPQAGENGGFLMEDLLLKGQSLGLQSCFLSFPDSEKVKSALGIRSPLTVTAIAALGYGLPRQKKLRVNSKTMGCVDIIAQRGYYAPKKDIRELAFVDTVDNIQGLDERIGFCEDPLWQGLYGVSKAPSYLNRQPYAFLLRERDILLVRQPDPYTDESSFRLDLGIAMLHFTAAAEQWGGRVTWSFRDLPSCSLPAGYVPAALCRME